MSFFTGAQYIGSNLVEFPPSKERSNTRNNRSTITRNIPLHSKSGFSIRNVGQSMPWRSLQVGSSNTPVTDIERHEPRFSFRSIKQNQRMQRPTVQKKSRNFNSVEEDESHSPFNIVKDTGADSFGGATKMITYSLLISFITIVLMVGIDQTIRPFSAWHWSSNQRNLKGRKCVLNFFIDKHPRNEYDPDFGVIGEEESTVAGTHWTTGQFKVITRFISSVSGTFRHKIHLQQHLIFAGTRDGGYLAEKAFESWPKRGSRFSEIHIVAADSNPNTTDSLEYSYLDNIEKRFHGRHNVHIYDRHGVAGITQETVDDDSIRNTMSSFEESNSMIRSSNQPEVTRPRYPRLMSFIQREDNDVDMDSEIVIPYLHVDGLHMVDQFEVLMSAVPLLKAKTIVSVGIEHSPDMNVMKMIKFFDSVDYKTFFLGSRQLARIDNLCPETLKDVLAHPFINTVYPKWSSILLNKLGIKSEEDFDYSDRSTPPFYVALPRGRINREEMAIQHAYDLFGGWDGEKNVKTANDRVGGK